MGPGSRYQAQLHWQPPGAQPGWITTRQQGWPGAPGRPATGKLTACPEAQVAGYDGGGQATAASPLAVWHVAAAVRRQAANDLTARRVHPGLSSLGSGLAPLEGVQRVLGIARDADAVSHDRRNVKAV